MKVKGQRGEFPLFAKVKKSVAIRTKLWYK